MSNGIYRFCVNDFLQFWKIKGGVLINTDFGMLQNPVLCYAQMGLSADPKIHRRVRGWANMETEYGPGNVIYTLQRDMRQPMVCPSCTPLSDKIDKGIILGGVGSWEFRKSLGQATNYHINLNGEHDLLYVAPDGYIETAIRARLGYIAGRINLEQRSLGRIGAISPAPEINSDHLDQMFDFIRKTGKEFYHKTP